MWRSQCPLWVKSRHYICSVDYLVGDGEHARRNGQPERLGRFHVDDQVELGRLHNRKVARLITPENPPSVDPNLMLGVHNAWSVTHQATSRSVFGIGIDRRQRMACRERD